VPTGQSLSWEDARDAAIASGGHLATITSEGENNFALTSAQSLNGWWVLNSSPPYCVGPWLGGFQPPGSPEPAGGWRWVTDEPWGWTNWWAPANEPNNGCGGGEDYLHWLSQGSPNPSGSWNDVAFTDICGIPSPKSYLIEWSADCNGDGIVDYGQCRDGSLPDYNGNNIPDCCEAGTPCVVGNYPVQWRVEDGGNGHWYRGDIHPEGIDWPTARQSSEDRGGHLATLTASMENEFAFRLLPTVESWPNEYGPWIGGYRIQGAWAWVTGEPFSWTNWRIGEPNNDSCSNRSEDAIHMNIFSSGWNDFPPVPTGCDIARNGTAVWSHIVEWSADCNGDGIVDYGQILLGQLVDANNNGVPDSCEVDPCPADVTRNGVVDGVDLAAILGAWGTDGQNQFDCDIDNDGIVSGTDLAFVLGGWGPCP
jgi:hypothetical protein